MLIRPRAVCVSSKPDGCSLHKQSFQFGAHHNTACLFFYIFFSTLSSSAELFLVVSSFCGSCKLSIPKDSRVLIQNIVFSVMLPKFDSSHYDFGQYGCRICHFLQFCTFSVGHKPGVPDLSDQLRGTFRK